MKTQTCVVAVCAVAFLIFSTPLAFADDPVAANREALVKCLVKMAARAQEYYLTPTSEGGGGRSFANMMLGTLTTWPQTADGSFVLVAASSSNCVVQGTGVETGNDGSSPTQVIITVYADSLTLVLNN